MGVWQVVIRLDLHHSQIGCLVSSPFSSYEAAAVTQRHSQGAGTFDHMVVGYDVAFGIYDHTAAAPLSGTAL